MSFDQKIMVMNHICSSFRPLPKVWVPKCLNEDCFVHVFRMCTGSRPHGHGSKRMHTSIGETFDSYEVYGSNHLGDVWWPAPLVNISRIECVSWVSRRSWWCRNGSSVAELLENLLAASCWMILACFFPPGGYVLLHPYEHDHPHQGTQKVWLVVQHLRLWTSSLSILNTCSMTECLSFLVSCLKYVFLSKPYLGDGQLRWPVRRVYHQLWWFSKALPTNHPGKSPRKAGLLEDWSEG